LYEEETKALHLKFDLTISCSSKYDEKSKGKKLESINPFSCKTQTLKKNETKFEGSCFGRVIFCIKEHTVCL